MTIIRFASRIRRRKISHNPAYYAYEINVPARIVNEYGLERGELVEVIIRRIGVGAPGYFTRSFELLISTLMPELAVMTLHGRPEKKYIELLRRKLLEELEGYVGRAQDTSPEEDLRHAGGEGEEDGSLDKRSDHIHYIEGD